MLALLATVPAALVLGPRAWSGAGASASLTSFPVTGTCAYSDTFGYPWGTRNGKPARHEGIDVFGKRGSAVLAAFDGRILRQYASASGGNVIVVGAANGTYLVYAHLDGFAAGMRPGVRVRAGQTIGQLGATGDAANSGPHLHFELHPGGGAAVDPYAALRAVDGGRCTRASMAIVPRRARIGSNARA